MVKIAIQGHPTRGNEVIQILESLGGKNTSNHNGKDNYAYYISSIDNRIYKTSLLFSGYKHYTLEEFEKEFPFKIGDKVIHSYSPNFIGTVVDIKFDDYISYRVNIEGKIYTCGTKSLKPYKEMKEERNITLTLDKAKEWYKKGGELKEVALQAYSKEELTKNKLSKTWEEFCENYPIKIGEYFIDSCSDINEQIKSNENRNIEIDKNVCPSKKSAEAHLALIQLEQLRDCYRQGDIPDFTKAISKYCIAKINKRIDVLESSYTSYFLSFTKKEIAEKFLNNFKLLIKIAEDYI